MEFAGVLRDWRTRRRVSQLELALRAGTTQRHVSFLERGRSAPGRAMVVRLAESLEIPLRERNALLLSAGYAPAYPQTALNGPELAPVLTALERVMAAHMPYPAVVVDRLSDLVAANDAFFRLVADADPELLEPPVNVARVVLHPRGLARRIENLDEWAWHVIDNLSRRAERDPDDELRALVEELEELLPARRRAPGPDHLGFSVPLRLRSEFGEMRLLTTLTYFATAVDVTVAELKMEAFLPADEETAAALNELARRSATRSPPPSPRGRSHETGDNARMAYDEALADRVRPLIGARGEPTERKMFGGVTWMLQGNMACGVLGDDLCVRLLPEDADRALANPSVRRFEMTGRPARGFVVVAGEAVREDDALTRWVNAGADYALSLPPK